MVHFCTCGDLDKPERGLREIQRQLTTIEDHCTLLVYGSGASRDTIDLLYDQLKTPTGTYVIVGRSYINHRLQYILIRPLNYSHDPQCCSSCL